MEKIIRPNLFLVGSPKCGTSFLWKKLKEHKEIFCPHFPQKELNFFFILFLSVTFPVYRYNGSHDNIFLVYSPVLGLSSIPAGVIV